MFIRNLTKHDYIHSCDLAQYPIDWHNSKDNQHVLFFNKDIIVKVDPWMHHLHLKVTNRCNAKCKFCVEQNSICGEFPDKVLKSTELALNELKNTDLLFSVSVTGGEPLLFKEFHKLCEILQSYDIPFLTMNTNAKFIDDSNIDLIDKTFKWINVSRHRIDDIKNDNVFCSKQCSLEELKYLKSKLVNCKMRIQCVMDHVYTPAEMNSFTKAMSFADDISYRRLMALGTEYGVSYDLHEKAYNNILEYAYENFKFIEQSIQDYYVYEVWHDIANDINVTFSYSNMQLLRTTESSEPDNLFREFVIHPNGVFGGSWKPGIKTLFIP